MADKRETSQIERFKKTARELGCDESEERFNEKLKRIAKQKKIKNRKKKDED